MLSPVTFHSAILDQHHMTYMYIFIFGFADSKSSTCSRSSCNVDLDLLSPMTIPTILFVQFGLISRFSLSLSFHMFPCMDIFSFCSSCFRSLRSTILLSLLLLSIPSTSHSGVNKHISKVQVISKSYRPLEIKCVDESRAKSRQITVSHCVIQ